MNLPLLLSLAAFEDAGAGQGVAAEVTRRNKRVGEQKVRLVTPAATRFPAFP